ncbi:Uncharacterised protein g10996 [Pycnogonum litorale]
MKIVFMFLSTIFCIHQVSVMNLPYRRDAAFPVLLDDSAKPSSYGQNRNLYKVLNELSRSPASSDDLFVEDKRRYTAGHLLSLLNRVASRRKGNSLQNRRLKNIRFGISR